MNQAVRSLALVVAIAVPTGCDRDAVEKDAKETASQAASAVADGAATAVASGIGKAKELAGQTQELKAEARSWLEKQKDAEEGTLQRRLAEGTEWIEVGAGLADAFDQVVDSDTTIQPIYASVSPGEEAEVDAAIEAMPKVEVIDGVTVGFRQVDELSVEKKSSERAYLVMWRRDRSLIGFFYRSTSTIDFNALVEITPKLLPLIEQSAKLQAAE